MSDWTAGYVADIGYTYGCYTELNPLRVRLAFLNAGLAYPEIGTACELGFGQGVSVNFHAAASMTQWHGTDFNPSQAALAQELANVSGSGAKLYDDAFADFTHRSDLPDFDYIGIHGIWSWVSEENRRFIVEFIRKKLKVGGVLYISYNTLPGWAAFAPLRHLMTEHADIIGAEGTGIVSRINGALDFTEKLLATNPNYFSANPQIAERFEKIKGQNRHYLAHEYFNRDWHPMHFATMAEWMEPAKVSYACSAHFIDHIELLNLSAEQQAFLKEIPDPMFRESARDFMVNQQFRRDYWVKGARKLTALERYEALQRQQVILTTSKPDVQMKIVGTTGEVSLAESIYNPILDFLAEHKPKTLGQIEQAMAGKPEITFAHVLQAVVVLSGAGHLAAVQDDTNIAQLKKQTDKLNAHLMHMARGSNDISYLASPVTAGGFAVGRFQQLFLLSISQGKKKPAEWAEDAWQTLKVQGQKIVKEDKTLVTPEENLAELKEQAKEFAVKRLPIIRALQIA